MKVLGIVGSKRKSGNTAFLVEEMLNAIKCDEIDTDIIFLGDYNFSGCTGCEGCKNTYKCVIKDDMQKIYPLLLNSDAIVLGSPTYFYNISSDMKAFIERLYCFEVFDEEDRSVWMSVNEALGIKYVSAIAICEQEDIRDMGFTAEAMTQPMEALGYRVVDTVKVLKAFKKGDAKQNDQIINQVQISGERLKKTLMLRKKLENNVKKAY